MKQINKKDYHYVGHYKVPLLYQYICFPVSEKLFGNEIMEQPESGRVSVSGKDATFVYRGKEYKTPNELVN